MTIALKKDKFTHKFRGERCAFVAPWNATYGISRVHQSLVNSTDIATAYYPDAAQVIISLAEEPPTVRAYFIVDGDVSDVPMEVG